MNNEKRSGNIRERQEAREHEILGQFATFADKSAGRDRPEEECDIRTCFQRDRDRILHSKSFRRLKQKTQVFLEPQGDHYRTRMTHTLEVAQNARTIARALRLNEDLTEAIALGHDLGHTPFGHAGERALDKIMKELGFAGFRHNEQSVRVVEVLEKNGKGLNLTKETRDGILNHETFLTPATPEGKIVRLSDKIAYVNSDIDDAIRAGLLTEDDLPGELTAVLGHSTNKRLNTLVHDMVENSWDSSDIHLSETVNKALFDLRAFLFESVYTNPVAKSEEKKVINIISALFDYYYEKPDEMPAEFIEIKEREGKERAVCDFIACMSDTYSVNLFKDIMIPKSWSLAGVEHR
ncbi:MAG: deoxyguanosinetriphosphate triphosphohydrolase [Lachnospiraceae bacterium]|jgi:dGTPase|nr:deoxyguanosinetriphosphate triphosphohydrolase [Lachnospiraceae bacterium]MEE3462002.1 deoxyguanosinetriphosphate triphosphohydrolase [Lachnospiraceae bacterium]